MKVFGGNVTADDGEDVTKGEVPAVGEGVKKNEFVNGNVLGDGEADIGYEDGDNNEGVFFFRLLFKGITCYTCIHVMLGHLVS